ncbi:hypothetical protein C7212DRAFT_331192 [Tuber magnatum]|uniref:Uncharacterized protein n=1 Tax=Tuber magnatum TaxID=42249 RepID=A0A317SKE3_9PEZI|nr:hypothetical protein C7212DRAFT_331192 [Tuber magnatum]
MPLEELGMEYFDDPRGVPLAPPEKPLARKGINASRGSGMPKKIFRGPKHRAIEAIRQANADREAAKSVMGVEETRVRAEDGLEMPLPLTIMTAPDSTIRDTRVVSNLKVFQSSQDTSGISCKNQNTEALKVQAQAVNPKPECSQAIVVPKVVPGLQEYLGAGINNLEAAAVQNSDFDYWDFLLDPRFLGQVGGTGDPLDEFLRTDNNNNQTLLPPTSSRPNNRSLPNRSFSDTGPSITSGPSQSQPFNNIPSRVLSNISEIDNSNREFCHNSTHSRTIPGTQIPQNNFSLVHNTITNPVPPGHQGFNFNEQVLNTISSQSFSTNNSYLSNDEVLSQYTNLDWLQNSGHDSSTTTNTRFPSSTSPTSNTSLNLNSTLPTSKNVEAVALESMTGNEWLDQFDLDFNGDLSLLPF